MKLYFSKYATRAAGVPFWGVDLLPVIRLSLQNSVFTSRATRQCRLVLQLAWLTAGAYIGLEFSEKAFIDHTPNEFAKAFKQAVGK